MKRIWTLLLVSLLATFALTGCGDDKNNGAASRAMDNGAASRATDNGYGDNGYGGNSVTDNGVTGTDRTPAHQDPSDSLMNEGALNADGTVNNTTRAPVQGATYEQMLRNGTVHDKDGILTDHENAMTPGTLY